MLTEGDVKGQGRKRGKIVLPVQKRRGKTRRKTKKSKRK